MLGKLEQLIDMLCPNGVEYIKLSDFATVRRGGSFQKKDFVAEGNPCIHYGQIYTKYHLFVKETAAFLSDEVYEKQVKAGTNDIVMAVTSENLDDVCKCVVWLGETEVAVSGHTAIIHHNQNAKYLAYFFNSSLFYQQKVRLAHGAKVIEVTPDTLNDVKIPIPPSPIQEEIVRILDSFTEFTAELTAKLTAELTARQQQYEYYRNVLLGKNADKKPLSKIMLSSRAGGTPLKHKKEYYDGGNIPWLRTQEVVFNEIHATNCFITELAVQETSAKWIPVNCVIVAISGASAGRCAINKIPLTTNQHCLAIEIDPTIAMYKYVFYCVSNQYEELLTKKEGARGDLNASKILSLEIPVPPLPEQERIVEILDRFDTLCGNISEGLSAEIKSRQQQYEYYRDKLFNFKEKEVVVN